MALVVCTVLAPPLLLGDAFFLRDAQSWFYPSRLYLRQHLLAGELPRWIPELNLGMPFLADPGNGVFYPGNLLLLLPAPDCVGQLLVAHVLLAALGTYFLLGVLGLAKSARVFGALGFGLSGYTLSMTSSGVYLISMAWMPLVAALGLQAQRYASLRRTATFSIALGCQLLGGEPQSALFTAGVLFALLATEPLRPPAHWLHLLAGGVLGVLLAAPQLLLALSFLHTSERRLGLGLDETSMFSVHPLRLLELLAPGVFGNAYDNPLYLGYFLTSDQKELTPWSGSLYCGSLTIAFAVYALVSRSALGRGRRRSICVVLVLSSLLALGLHTPVFGAYQSLIPGAAYFRYPEKFFALVTLCLVLLGAAGVDAALRREQAPEKALLSMTLGLGAALGALLLFGDDLVAELRRLRPVVDPARALEHLQLALAPELVLVSLALLVFLWVHRRSEQKSWLGPSLALLVTLQLSFANHHLAQTTSGDVYAASPTIEHLRAAGAPNEARRLFVPDRTGSLFADCLREFDQARVAQWKRLVLKMNTGIVHGVHYARSYTSFASPETDLVWQRFASTPDRAFDLFSVGYFLAPTSRDRSANVVASTRCFSVYQNQDRLPYARVVRQALSVPTLALALSQLHEPEVQSGGVALLVSRRKLPPGTAGPSQACRYRRPSAEHISIRCSAEAAGWLVVNEAFHPGWRATVNGKPVPVQRANGLVMGLAIPRGPIQAELNYTEPSLVYGVASFGITLLILLCMLLVRSRPPRSPNP